jgi:hypothetical protein
MSAETRTVEGHRVSWMDINDGRNVKIGTEYVSHAELNVGMLLFLAGEKDFDIGDMRVVIPESVDGNVQVGNNLLPYKEFVDGVIWTLFVRPQTWEDGLASRALNRANHHLGDKVIRPHLEQNLPASNPDMAKLAWGMQSLGA